MNSVIFGNSKIKYKVKKNSRRKTSQILIDRTGVQIITPFKKNQKQIENMVKNHLKWIYKKQLWIKEESNKRISYQNGTRLPYLGKNHVLDVKVIKGKESFVFQNGKFNARVNKISKQKIKKLFIEWTRQKSLPIFEKSVKKYSKKLGVKTGKILIKNQIKK